MKVFLNMSAIDWRQTDTFSLISSLRRYATSMEAQMELLRQEEQRALKSLFGEYQTEDEIGEFRTHTQHLEDQFDLNLKVTMRYSFVVFTHIVFETRLRVFCDDVWREKMLPVKIEDFRESRGLERAKIYLTTHAQMDFGRMPSWCRLMVLQKIRDCIVHTNGFVEKSRDRVALKAAAAKSCGMSLDDEGRLLLSKDFCQQSLSDLENFFRDIFTHAGWKESRI